MEAYDRNQDFGKRDVLGEDYIMDLPDNILYKDINSETIFVEFKMGAIEAYLRTMNKSIDSDAENLYKEKFIKYIRLACANNIFYIKGECRAQMKKTVTYKIDIAIDSDGCIIECQCECAAGMGPSAHCKHVCCMLLALHGFSSNGEILTEETCTQRLQTFHQSKAFKGSPIKASNLPLSKKKASDVIFDPRPAKYRKQDSYKDYFRNTCLNYKEISKFPVSQIFQPANLYAVASDHDYLEGHPEDRWLKENKISSITVDDIDNIDALTRGQSNNKFWQQERCFRLQASNFGRICKATERTNFESLAESLTVVKDIKTPAIIHGRKYELIALAKYEDQKNRGTKQSGIRVSSSHPFIGASPDAIVDNELIVEVKCPYVARNEIITPKTVPFLLKTEDNLTLDRNHNYFYQIQGQLFCTGAARCDLVVYTFKDLKCINIDRDEQFINDMVIKLQEFYNKFFRSAVLRKFFYKNYHRYSFDS